MKKVYLFLFFFFILFTFFYPLDFCMYEQNFQNTNIGPITDKIFVKIPFEIFLKNISKIRILVGTYRHIKSCNLFCQIEEEGIIKSVKQINSENFEDNSHYTIRFSPPLEMGNSKNWSINFFSDATIEKENFITLYASGINVNRFSSLYINDTLYPSFDLYIQIYSSFTLYEIFKDTLKSLNRLKILLILIIVIFVFIDIFFLLKRIEEYKDVKGFIKDSR